MKKKKASTYEDCPVCGLVDVTTEDRVDDHTNRWGEPCPASGLFLGTEKLKRVILQSECNHHWHSPRSPLRERREGQVQGQCCKCEVRAWLRLKRKKSCMSPAAPLPKAESVDVTYE